MKVLFCASEVVPFAKTGGLADVAGALPLELFKLGVEVKVVMPRYKCIDPLKFELKKIDTNVSVSKLFDAVDIYFIESTKYFERDGN